MDYIMACKCAIIATKLVSNWDQQQYDVVN